MYLAPPFLAQPPDDARLWRYMTPTSFLLMLLGRSLFFATLDTDRLGFKRPVHESSLLTSPF